MPYKRHVRTTFIIQFLRNFFPCFVMYPIVPNSTSTNAPFEFEPDLTISVPSSAPSKAFSSDVNVSSEYDHVLQMLDHNTEWPEVNEKVSHLLYPELHF